MKRVEVVTLAVSMALCIGTIACNGGKSNPAAEAPPPLKVEKVQDRNVFQVDQPEKYQLTQAVERLAAPELKVTGTVNPDISRAVPVISLATGRVVEIDARLGDTVKKGQVLLKVQSADISGAYSDYQKAKADEQLANTQLERAKILFDHGAISQNDLQVAQDIEAKAKVDVQTTAERLRVLGSANLDKPSGVVEIRAPISGFITDQQVTNAAGVAGLGSANPFTISDLSTVWILCDVYENDLANVRLGDKADVRLTAYLSLPESSFGLNRLHLVRRMAERVGVDFRSDLFAHKDKISPIRPSAAHRRDQSAWNGVASQTNGRRHQNCGLAAKSLHRSANLPIARRKSPRTLRARTYRVFFRVAFRDQVNRRIFSYLSQGNIAAGWISRVQPVQKGLPGLDHDGGAIQHKSPESPLLSRSTAFVSVVQPADLRQLHHLPALGWLNGARNRRILFE